MGDSHGQPSCLTLPDVHVLIMIPSLPDGFTKDYTRIISSSDDSRTQKREKIMAPAPVIPPEPNDSNDNQHCRHCTRPVNNGTRALTGGHCMHMRTRVCTVHAADMRQQCPHMFTMRTRVDPWTVCSRVDTVDKWVTGRSPLPIQRVG